MHNYYNARTLACRRWPAGWCVIIWLACNFLLLLLLLARLAGHENTNAIRDCHLVRVFNCVILRTNQRAVLTAPLIDSV